MSTHDKMTTDYLWLRDHSAADSNIKTRFVMIIPTYFIEPMVITTCIIMSPTEERDLK